MDESAQRLISLFALWVLSAVGMPATAAPSGWECIPASADAVGDCRWQPGGLWPAVDGAAVPPPAARSAANPTPASAAAAREPGGPVPTAAPVPDGVEVVVERPTVVPVPQRIDPDATDQYTFEELPEEAFEPTAEWAEGDWPTAPQAVGLGALAAYMGSPTFGPSVLATGAPYWRFCQPTDAQALPRLPAVPADNVGEEAGFAESDYAEFTDDARQTKILTGNVVTVQGDQLMRADRAVIRENPSRVDLEGNVRYRDPDLGFEAAQGYILPDTDEGRFEDVRYYVPQTHGSGTAAEVDLETSNRRQYEGATFTTCYPTSNAWSIKSQDLRINDYTGRGHGIHNVLRIFDVPILYIPYVYFPIDDRRQSGFLTPTIGSSQNNGFELRAPFYWNIAWNMDATLRPRYMAERGLMLGTEYRYLFPGIEGIVNVDYLPNDEVSGENRYYYSWLQQIRFSPRLTSEIRFQETSDKEFFEQFGEDLFTTSQAFLRRTGTLAYAADYWSAGVYLEDLQSIDPGLLPQALPYSILPRFDFDGLLPDQSYGLTYGLLAQATNFDHDDRVRGWRLHTEPQVSLPWRRPFGFVTPKLQLALTQYELEDDPSTIDATTTRALPIASLDAGIFLERVYEAGAVDLLHTIEPRLHYLYIPEADQDDIPLFDTAEQLFTYDQLWRDNRFTNHDRIGDANQLSLGVTSRLIDTANGFEWLTAEGGAIVYFDDRDVQLSPHLPPDTESTSALAGQLTGRLPNGLAARAEAVWDPHTPDTQLSKVSIGYSAGPGRFVNGRYSYELGRIGEWDFIGRWPILPQLYVVGRYYHSFRQDQLLENLVGLEYESCCWIARTVWRRFQNSGDPTEDENQLFYFQIELKGLTSVGQAVDELLYERVPGYPKPTTP